MSRGQNLIRNLKSANPNRYKELTAKNSLLNSTVHESKMESYLQQYHADYTNSLGPQIQAPEPVL